MQDILISKITIPSLSAESIRRETLYRKLKKISAYTLSVFTAGAGYGKTTALIQYLSGKKSAVGWYNLGPEDDNIYFFAIYLVNAINHIFPGLYQWYGTRLGIEEQLDWKTLFFCLMTGIEQYNSKHNECFLVIDDWQYAHQCFDICMFFDRFLAHMPANIHVVLISREYVMLPEVERMRLQGRVLDFFPQDLLFTAEEIAAFFRMEQLFDIDEKEIQEIFNRTEGWIIVIKLLANQWKDDVEQLSNYLKNGNFDLDCFFEYLSHTIFNRQSLGLQDFLMKTSLVQSFDSAYCREVLEIEYPVPYLDTVAKTGLFISKIGTDAYRYHSLFQEFLQKQAKLRIVHIKELYDKIAVFYQKHDNAEWALYFFLQEKRWDAASEILSAAGRYWILCGRQEVFMKYLQKLPETYRRHPKIYMALGDRERISSSYEKAVYWYKKARKIFYACGNALELSQCCRSMGELYLDIIQPDVAQTYLRQAYKLLPAGSEREKGDVLALMSENMINHGYSHRAERYLRLRKWVLPFDQADKNNLQARICLRTGRIQKAIHTLENKYREEAGARTPCSFRECSLILSLCYCFMGDVSQAISYSSASIEYGNKVQSPFVSLIGYVRMGHALLLDFHHTGEICRQAYHKAMMLAEQLRIARGTTEMYWGQCLLYALEGNWEESRKIGMQALTVTTAGHDNWFAAILYHALGMSAALCGNYDEGQAYSLKALKLFEKCRDSLGQTACYWQLTYQCYKRNDKKQFQQYYKLLLTNCHKYNYAFILERKTLLGDIAGFDSKEFELYSAALDRYGTLSSSNTAAIVIQTLGGFKLFRNGSELGSEVWRRKAAKKLLVVLISMYTAPISRETLMNILWPHGSSKEVQRNFKVVLNYLLHVLEPARQPRARSRFIVSTDSFLQLHLDEQLQLDVQAFERSIHEGCMEIYRHVGKAQKLLLNGLHLYKGEFMAGEVTDDIVLRERERLRLLALRGAETLGFSYIEQKKYDQAIYWANHILQIDICWESAYQLKLISYGELHDQALLIRTITMCSEQLKKELNVAPSLKTREIYQKYSMTNN